MSTLETRIAEECTSIARTHRYDGHDFRDKDPQNCKCGWKGEDYAAHLETLFAAALAPVIAEAQAEAWDACVHAADKQWTIGHTSAQLLRNTNPYRSNDDHR